MRLMFVSYTTALTVASFLTNAFFGCDVASAQEARGSVRALTHTDRSLQNLGVIDKLLLYNANTDQPILALSNGLVINTATLNVSSFNIEATIANGGTGSIQFGYNSNANVRVESDPPYAFCGNARLNYFSCPVLTVGQHTVTATSFSGTKATGTVTSSTQISFRIVNNPPTKAPTTTPTNAPTKAPTKAPVKAPTKAPVTPEPCTFPKFTSGWQRFTPDYPLKIAETHAEMIGNDIVMTNGFLNGEKNITNTTYARDVTIVNSTWRRMDEMPRAVGLTHSATAIIGTKIYLCGGYVGPHPGPHTADCFVYDHSIPPGFGRQWSVFPSLPNGGASSGGLFYDAGTNALYFTGGATRPIPNNIFTVDVNRTYKFSFNTPSVGWVDSTPIPYTSNHPGYVTVHYQGTDRHYYFGGHEGDFQLYTNKNDVFEFVASNETWIRRTSLPYPRGHVSTATRRMGNCGLVVVGGMIDGSTVNGVSRLNGTSDIHYYHVPADNWTKIGNLVGVRSSAFVLTSTDTMYFITDVNSHSRKFQP